MVDEVPIPDRLEQALAKRKARIFWAASLPRKWSMRKIWSSAKTSCSWPLRETALSRSVPKGFSMIIPAAADEVGIGQEPYGGEGGGWRHAQIVDAAALAPQRLLGPFQRLSKGLGPAARGMQSRHSANWFIRQVAPFQSCPKLEEP
jgi:hypothetical protein